MTFTTTLHSCPFLGSFSHLIRFLLHTLLNRTQQPPWLDTSVFSSASFDPDAFIAAIRPHVPLEAARAQLKEHLAALHSQLVELINRDYNDFVNLSTKLVSNTVQPRVWLLLDHARGFH